MNPRTFLLFCLVLLVTSSTQASKQSSGQAELTAVIRAQRLLDEGAWSQIIAISNDQPDRKFGSKVWGLAFEFGDRVWIYLPQIGTQSPAARVKDLAKNQRDLRGVLGRINRGFSDYTEVEPDSKYVLQAAKANLRDLPNGCLIESLATLRKLVRSGVDVSQADLLMYYTKLTTGLSGHTVLVYRTEQGRFVWDPARPEQSFDIGDRTRNEPMALAKAVAERKVRSRLATARLMAIDESEILSPMVAGLDGTKFGENLN